MWALQYSAEPPAIVTNLPVVKKMPKIVRDLMGLPATLGRVGDLEIRLATTKKEIRKAQRLRYRVFFEEGHAIPDRTAALLRRDICPFDRVCDHLLVIDHAARSTHLKRKKSRVVGAYRFLRQDVAMRNFGFYSTAEFDVTSLIARHPGKRFMELGRSCVLEAYRSKRVIELLWQGIAAYVQHHGIDVMFGCASFEGVRPQDHAEALGYLHHHAKAKGDYAASALANRYSRMDVLGAKDIDPRRAIAAMPPLVKGYLRIGARFGDGAVIDWQFNTTDVLVILAVDQIEARYLNHFIPQKVAMAA
ncbi:GNAT family N-acetyltransferase [Methylovirgula sp. 4M-Z18]|uniref:GNAT family N-acetyltransferase n=1 Tax=Methylovirgula sp. 4M-Z18 TaxID=2293567 RepID=UPI000E2EAE6B|nr:GNAT family N-acetyltransferase [Methylovirgula sp. 4M-Z18]RFB75569.1 GNAT family N-acetyltransferase [Methylovirgula sp. 4M-Z18]